MPFGQLIERLIGKVTSKRSQHCTLAAAGLLLGLAIAGRPAYAQEATAARAAAPDSLISVQVVDFTQRFLTFYEAARAEQAEADRRWKLWQEHYGFSSTPPTAEGRVRDGTPVVAIPVEEEREARALSMSHEFVHAVHTEVADLPGGWERSIPREAGDARR